MRVNILVLKIEKISCAGNVRVNILVLKIEKIQCAGNVRVIILVPVLFCGTKLVLPKLVVLNLVP